jgi:hypothetical protein
MGDGGLGEGRITVLLGLLGRTTKSRTSLEKMSCAFDPTAQTKCFVPCAGNGVFRGFWRLRD